MVTKVLPSRLPPVVVASPDLDDARAIKSILDDYIKPFDIVVNGYDQFSSCSTGRFTFNLLARYFETGKEPPTVFVSSALDDGRGWVYGQSLTPGFYFCLVGGSMDPDPFYGTSQKDMEQLDLMFDSNSSVHPSQFEKLSPNQLRMMDIYKRFNKDWNKVLEFLVYGMQMTMIELRHKSQPFMCTISAVRAVTPRGIVSRISGIEDAIALYFEDSEDSEDSK